MTEAQKRDKEAILRQVEAYAAAYHVPKAYEAGARVNYAGRVYDGAELRGLVDSALDFWLTAGSATRQFEEELSAFLALPYCSFVNSGSSANLLAFMALTSPRLGERAVQRGDEVITVAAGFPTTISPILQYGAVPVFVDITIPEYNIDVSRLEEARSEKTKAVMLAHTLGNPFDVAAVKRFCEQHGLWLIEDNCDALGARYEAGGFCGYTGSFGDLGTSSFYPPHHITTGEGGAVYTRDPLLHKIVRSLRDWGRDCVCESGQDDLCGHRFAGQFGEMPRGYDHKYIYSHFGYNLKATDLQAAIGVEQLRKFPGFMRRRAENVAYLRAALQGTEEQLMLPQDTKGAEPCYFGFMLTCREEGRRDRLVERLEAAGVQTRMLFAGNMIRQPCFDEMRESGVGFRVVGTLANTDAVMRNAFWIGVYPGMQEPMLETMARTIKEGLASRGETR